MQRGGPRPDSLPSLLRTHRPDPIQFAAELASLKQRPKYEGRALYVKLPDEVARIFESPLVPIRHSLAISGGMALPVAVATFQAAGSQVVCLVPLATEEARAWLVESVEKQGRIFVAVSIDECKQMVVIQAEPPVRDFTGRDWLAVKERLSNWCSVDRASEVMDMLEVLRFWFTKDLKYVKGKPCKPYNSTLGEFFRVRNLRRTL